MTRNKGHHHIFTGPLAGSNDQSFSLVYEKNKHLVYNSIAQFLGCSATAEDTTQEVFIKAWLKWPHIRSRDKITGYLLRMARNECINRLKQEQRHKARIKNSTPFLISNNLFTAEELLDAKELGAVIIQARKELTKAQEKIFHLMSDYGFDSAATAGILMISKHTVTTHRFQYTKRIRQHLNMFMGTGPRQNNTEIRA